MLQRMTRAGIIAPFPLFRFSRFPCGRFLQIRHRDCSAIAHPSRVITAGLNLVFGRPSADKTLGSPLTHRREAEARQHPLHRAEIDGRTSALIWSRSVAVQVHLQKETCAQSLFNTAVDACGTADILLNAAGIEAAGEAIERRRGRVVDADARKRSPTLITLCLY